MVKKLVVCSFLSVLTFFTLSFCDNVPFSQSPPGGLSPEQCPMFVCFGFDDNGYADGIQWFRKLIENKRNPDGSTVRATFFNTGNYGERFTDVATEWKLLALDGHEIGNHSWDHPHGRPLTTQQWQDQITQARDFMVQNCGISANEMVGFRTPYLEYGLSTFEALKNLGFLYDCSIEFGFNGWEPIPGDPDFPPESSGVWYNSMISPRTHQKLFWPHTLNNGSPPGNSSYGNPTIAGLWEIPVYTYRRPDSSGVVPGFDFNLWTTSTKTYFANTLKHNFDLRRTGNRNPLSVNVHSDYYTADNDAAESAFPNAGWADRRQAVEDFLDYVLQFPETRVRPMKDMIAWMKNPIPIGPTSISPEQKTFTTIESFSLKNATTRMIEFTPPSHSAYTLSILDMRGRTVTKFSNFFHGEKNYRYVFTTPLPIGAYMVRINDDNYSAVRKAVLVQ